MPAIGSKCGVHASLMRDPRNVRKAIGIGAMITRTGIRLYVNSIKPPLSPNISSIQIGIVLRFVRCYSFFLQLTTLFLFIKIYSRRRLCVMLQLRIYVINIKFSREFCTSGTKEKLSQCLEEIIENANERDYIRDSNKRYFT